MPTFKPTNCGLRSNRPNTLSSSSQVKPRSSGESTAGIKMESSTSRSTCSQKPPVGAPANLGISLFSAASVNCGQGEVLEPVVGISRIVLLTDLNYVFVAKIRLQSIQIRQCIGTPAGYDSEVGARNAGVRLAPIAFVTKVAVSVEVDEPKSPESFQSHGRPQKGAAVPTDHDWDSIGTERRGDFFVKATGISNQLLVIPNA